MLGRIAGFLVILFLCAGATPLRTGIANHDVLTLEALSREAVSPEQRLAQGAALALRHKDDAALALLTPFAQAGVAEQRAGACLALSDIYLRLSRFAEAHAALHCVDAIAPLSGEAKQALAWSAILAAERPMQKEGASSGKLEASRDSAGLLRVTVAINGKEQAAVLDSDASFCVVSETVARRLGIRVLPTGATILTSTRSDLPMHLGVADSLTFGDSLLRNVVFAVLPDSAVRFGHGYTMEAVIGLPVFVALGRVSFVREGGWESLLYGHQPGEVAGEANMVLSGLDPFVLVTAPKTGAVLRLAIDSAASNTMLNGTALQDFPALRQGASFGAAQWEGGGGAATDSKALTLSELTLAVAGRPFTLKRVSILSTAEPDRHGAIGQDLFKQAKRWTLDFDAMRFSAEE